MGVELGMEDGILRGVAGMDVLHESRKIPVDREVGGHEEPLDDLDGRNTSVTDVGHMKADLAVLHVHLEFADWHIVVGAGDEFGHGGAQLFLTDIEGVVGGDLDILALVGDPDGKAVVRILAAQGERKTLLLGEGGVVEVFGFQVVDEGLEDGIVLCGHIKKRG